MRSTVGFNPSSVILRGDIAFGSLAVKSDTTNWTASSSKNILDRTLHQQLRVLLVQPFDPVRHRLVLLVSRQAVEEERLEIEFRHALLLLDGERHLEQTVRLANPRLQWGITTAHDDAVVRLLNDFEMIGHLRADLVRRPAQLIGRP